MRTTRKPGFTLAEQTDQRSRLHHHRENANRPKEKQTKELTFKATPMLRLGHAPAARRRDGVALVIVLGFLVLLTVLIVAFFASVTSEYSSAKTYAAGASTRFLSESAVNVVMAQIAKGTQGQQAGSPTRYTWASQPGMIRTYDDSGAYGSCYKLYSCGHMVTSADPATVLWRTWRRTFRQDGTHSRQTSPTSNAPVVDSNGKLNFPILDGNLEADFSWAAAIGSGHTTTTTTVFRISRVSPSNLDSVPNYDSKQPVSATNNPAPMPGAMALPAQGWHTPTAPDQPAPGTVGTTATLKNTTDPAKIPTAAYPIVGRIAFWTDDETCKLNINTATEGTYFAYTRVNSPTEMASPSMPVSQNPPYPNKPFGFAMSPPATGEYNRYPGHPATTCLSPALGHWLDNPNGLTPPSAYTSAANDNAFLGLTASGTPPSLSAGDTFTGLSAYLLLSPKSSGAVAGFSSRNRIGKHQY